MIRDTDRDCGATVCSLETRFLATCTLYVDEAPDLPCNYPCSLDHCTTEIHHYIQCPVWICVDKTTTSRPEPISTLPPHPHGSATECSSALCITSVTANVIMVLVFAALVVFLKKRFSRPTQENSFENALYQDPTFDLFANEPIVRRSTSQASHVSENLPLLRVESEGTRTFERQRGHTQGSTRASGSVSSSTSTIPLTPATSGPILAFGENTASAPTLHFAENTF